jgi:ABC-type glycerol-3-phosphate transport system substrate-binding protein
MLACGVAALSLAAAAAYAAETVTFWQFSTNQPDIDAWNKIIKSFEADNPNIHVNMEIVPWSSQQQRLVSALTSGGLPDVSMLGNNVVAQFQAAGALTPLDAYFEQYDKENNTDVASEVWPGDKGYYNLAGHWWASPVMVETRALFYRKDMLEAAGFTSPPDTWQDLADDSAKITKATPAGVFGVGLPMSLTYGTVQAFMSAYLGYGAHMLNDQGKCGFDTPEFKDALSTYVSIYTKGGTTPDAPTVDPDSLRRAFLDGKYAMILTDPSFYRDLQNEKPDFIDAVDIAKVPAGPAMRAGFLGGWPLVLWNASEHKDAAAKWIMYATHGEGLRALAVAGGFIPGSSNLAKQAPWNAYPYPLFVEQLENALPYQYPSEAIPQMGQIEVDTIQKAVQAVALGQKDVDAATKQLCADIDSVLAR